ncbi:siroheme decarboxylase subunit beta [[Eubacterium] cellulosolvens]
MDDKDYAILRNIQDGIPLVSEPFAEVAQNVEITQEEVIKRLKKLNEEGIIRRFGASVSHKKIGMLENAMVTWRVPDDRVNKVGKSLAKYKEITHVYERLTIPKRWDYNLFGVIHGRDKDSIKEFIKRVSESLDLEEYLILFSIRQLKKSSIRLPEHHDLIRDGH